MIATGVSKKISSIAQRGADPLIRAGRLRPAQPNAFERTLPSRDRKGAETNLRALNRSKATTITCLPKSECSVLVRVAAGPALAHGVELGDPA